MYIFTRAVKEGGRRNPEFVRQVVVKVWIFHDFYECHIS